MKRTESNTYPPQTQLLQGVLLVNYDVQEINKNGEIMYNYAQDRLQVDATESDVLKAIAKGTEYWTKYRKNVALAELVIEANTIAYDADGRSIGNMASVLSVANSKFNRAVASGTPIDVAYKATYIDTLIGWKTADNSISMVNAEAITAALETSMNRVAEVIGAKQDYQR